MELMTIFIVLSLWDLCNRDSQLTAGPQTLLVLVVEPWNGLQRKWRRLHKNTTPQSLFIGCCLAMTHVFAQTT
jgi:hypothetical protein